MSKKFLTNLDLNLNQLLQALAEKLASDPGSPIEGQIWYNTTTHKLRVRINGSTVSFYPDTTTLDLIAAPAADVSMNSHKITSVTDPTSNQDAATKKYVDDLINGVAWKESVRVATTANGALSTAYENGDTVDGVTLATGNRILLKNQTTGSENGIYTVNASGAPTRALDADSTTDIESAAVLVEEGTTNAGTAWVLATDNVTVGTTAQVWNQFGTGGTSYSAGTGLVLTSTTFSAKAAAGDITGNGSATTLTFTHNLGTNDITYTIWETSTGDEVIVEANKVSTNAIDFKFGTAPANGKVYRVVAYAYA